MGNSLTLALYLATRARADTGDDAIGPKSNTRDRERAGFASVERPQGTLIWFHTGLDQGNSSVLEIARRMKAERSDYHFLFTTSAERRSRDQDTALYQHVPDESLPAIRRFLEHWAPNIAVWTETDMRPALISETSDSNVPLYLIDANTRHPSTQDRRWLRGMTGSLLARFEAILAGDEDRSGALRKLGAEPAKVEVAGFLEEGTPPLPCNETERDDFGHLLAARPVWLGANVTEAELSAVVAAHDQALRRSHRLLLVLVPDDPSSAARWARDISKEGFKVALRPDGEEPDPDTQVYLANDFAELGLWYRLAPISFLGRSLGPEGGINPYEAAALGSAIVHGPSTYAHRTSYEKLAAAGATRQLRSHEDLGEVLEGLLSPDAAATIAHEAWKVCTSGAEVTDRVRDLIFASLDERGVY